MDKFEATALVTSIIKAHGIDPGTMSKGEYNAFMQSWDKDLKRREAELAKYQTDPASSASK